LKIAPPLVFLVLVDLGQGKDAEEEEDE